MKQFLTILAVVMVFGMVACGEGNGATSTADSTAVDSVATDSTTAPVVDTVTASATTDTTSVK